MNGRVNVEIFDTTLRDGAQSLPKRQQFPIGVKPQVADSIASLGVDVIEAGFPATPSDFEQVQKVARTVGNQDYEVSIWTADGSFSSVTRPPVIAGLSRTTPVDVTSTWRAIQDASRPRIHTFISTDPKHMTAKFPGKSPETVQMMGRDAIRQAIDLSSADREASVEFSAEAASTTNMDYLEQVVRMAVSEGVDVINLPDTVGQRNPFWMRDFYEQAIVWALDENPTVTISAHNHNDLGMAVANSYSLVRAAAEVANRTDSAVSIQFETTICGLGERAGNADVFPVAADLFKFAGELAVPVEWHLNPSRSVGVANDVFGQTGNRWWNRSLKIGRQNPIVGSDTNRHRSGIHSDGILKGGHTIYTPHDPTFWGHKSDAVHEEGQYQGRAGAAAAHSGTT